MTYFPVVDFGDDLYQ